MASKRWRRPFSLATRLTFFISLATIASFFAFAWIMIHSVKVHFAEQDINDLQEISITLERIINQPNEPESRRLETLKNVVAGYSNVIISLVDSNQKAIFHSPNAPDLRQFIASAPDKNAHASDVFIISGPTLQTSRHIHGQKTSSTGE
jgi:two-component system heavy metal sensor histidine kinase CusS